MNGDTNAPLSAPQNQWEKFRKNHARRIPRQFLSGIGGIRKSKTTRIGPVNLFTPFAFEHRSKPVLSQRKFYHRLARCAALGIGVVLFALIIGMIGYHFLEGMKWIDAFTNASMILSGMGPMGELKTSGGKIFAGCYALFSGVTFLSSVGLIFAPIFHRFLHKFHFESAKEAKEK